MKVPGEPQGIEYSIYTPSDGDEMSRMLGETFSRRDPPAVAIGITATEFEFFVRLFCSRAAAEGLTIVARRADTRQMVGALLAEDSASAMPDGVERLGPKFEPIFDILGHLDAEYRAGRTMPPGESVHLFPLGVAESAGGGGIAQRLVSECMENGARKGYRRAVTEATNLVSQHIFRKLGFEERMKRSYASHRFAGRAMFESIVGHDGPMLMERPLTL